jgi:hypothetical protein
VDGLDESRLALHMLAQPLSLTAGPLRLFAGDISDRAFDGAAFPVPVFVDHCR